MLLYAGNGFMVSRGGDCSSFSPCARRGILSEPHAMMEFLFALSFFKTGRNSVFALCRGISATDFRLALTARIFTSLFKVGENFLLFLLLKLLHCSLSLNCFLVLFSISEMQCCPHFVCLSVCFLCLQFESSKLFSKIAKSMETMEK
jgi:hypothetical protein